MINFTFDKSFCPMSQSTSVRQQNIVGSYIARSRKKLACFQRFVESIDQFCLFFDAHLASQIIIACLESNVFNMAM